MAELFSTDRTSILRHIRNIYQTEELDEPSTCAKIAQVRFEGSRKISRTIPFYNLDMIISVGYRVNSICGTRFRRWANQVLKAHLLRGVSINQRFMLAEERIDQQLVNHEKQLQDNNLQHISMQNRLASLEKQVDFFVKANLPPSEGLLNAKSWWSGYEFACQLVRSAKEEIVIIDPYADDIALALIAKHSSNVKGVVYSAHVTSRLKEEAARLDRQFPTVELKSMQNVHDRFIIVDETVYHIGSSLNELGKKLTAFSVLNFVTKQQLLEMVK
ncbi:MAG: virulence RhuM family protein [Fibrobacter sp.]|nr:virulence RhuM family protein [Fibrobacter sp.]